MPFIGYRLLHSIYNWWRGSHLLARDARFQVQHEIFFQIDDWIKNNPPTIRDESSLKKRGGKSVNIKDGGTCFCHTIAFEKPSSFSPKFPNKFHPKISPSNPNLDMWHMYWCPTTRIHILSFLRSHYWTMTKLQHLGLCGIVETGQCIDGHQFVTQTSGAKTSQLQVLGGQLWDLFNISDLVQRLTWRLGS